MHSYPSYLEHLAGAGATVVELLAFSVVAIVVL